jgi:hypothetical protein
MRTAEEGREVFAKVERISAPLSPSDPHAWKDVGNSQEDGSEERRAQGFVPPTLSASTEARYSGLTTASIGSAALQQKSGRDIVVVSYLILHAPDAR